MPGRDGQRVLRILLNAGVAAALLTGCTSSRSFTRALRLSTVERNTAVAAVQGGDAPGNNAGAATVSDSTLDVGGTPEDPSELGRSVADPRRKPSSAVAESPSRLRRPRRAVRPHEESKTVPRDELSVLLTGFENDEDDTGPKESPPLVDETPNEFRTPIRLEVPPELPGSDVPGLRVPPYDPQQPLAERRAAIQKLYPALPELPAGTQEDPLQPRWSLVELEELAWEHHPALMQASAQVEAARGGMIQAGLHPNPTVGWEQDTIGPGIQGYKGPYVSQQIVTGGKLKLARCAAAMDYENAQIAYQKTRIEIATRVRSAYFDLLVSQQRRRMLTALARFTDDVYHAQIELVAGGQAAPYEPLQLRVFSVQARNAVMAANNGVIAAARRLGAASGLTDAEEFHIAGQADESPAVIDYRLAKAYLLDNHSELRTVRNQIVQSQYQSRLEYLRPRIPDIDAYGAYQHAYGVPPFVNSYNFQVGVPIPVFDRNQGNILATQSSLISRERGFAAAQYQLTGRLAELLARFDTARAQVENYRRDLLPDQVQSYRGVYSRYREGAEAENDTLNFGDVVVAQQTLSATVSGYADVLSEMWQAYVDAADLLQVEDLSAMQAWFGANE